MTKFARTRSRTRLGWGRLRVVLPAVALVSVVACSSGDTAGETATSTPPDSVVEVVDVFRDVDFYGVCGNEPLDLPSATYYPLLPEEVEDLDQSKYPADPAEGLRSGFAGPLRIVPPGPGDDIGTLLVYDDGIARFESESGNVIWLTLEERAYDWVC